MNKEPLPAAAAAAAPKLSKIERYVDYAASVLLFIACVLRLCAFYLDPQWSEVFQLAIGFGMIGAVNAKRGNGRLALLLLGLALQLPNLWTCYFG